METIGTIFNIQRYSIHDGPGIRTLVFFKGCPLRCLWCSNPESQNKYPEILFSSVKCIGCGKCAEVCPEDAIIKSDDKRINRDKCNLCLKCIETCYAEALEVAGKKMTVEEVIKEVEKDRPFYEKSGGGITVSGGEPLMQPKFLKELLKECKNRGINTAIETCGYVNWTTFNEVLEYIDLILFDLKHSDSNNHEELTGKNNNIIIENIKKISDLKKPMIIRFPLIPGCNDSIENIKRIGEFVKILDGVNEINIIPFHRLGESKYEKLDMKWTMHDVKPPEKDRLDEIKKILESYGLKVKIGG
ncbi:MAG: glycyl-radical enzyme activating protein [Candidatus Helarchaeota archaeon]|nr:glycyl-radical enzyme activating protein [Candidatus Helarchaeota archaeon]